MSSPKILAIKLRAIGDTVIWTSALNALRRRFPDGEIHVLTYAANAPVMHHQPAIDRAHFLLTHSRLHLVKALWRLRRERFDWLLGFHATTALCRWAWVNGARRMILHHHSWNYTPRGSLPLPGPGRLEDAISRDYQLLAPLEALPAKRDPTRLAVSEEEAANAEARLRHRIQAVGGDIHRPRWAILPGAAHPLRRYPKDLLVPWIEKLNKQGRYQPVVLSDGALSREWDLTRACERMGVPLFDGLGLRDFIACISRHQRALANDSGPGHIAVALGVPTDFLFGPGCAGDWHPYDQSIHPIHRVKVDCRLEGPREREEFQFCTVNSCVHHSCLRGIDLSPLLERPTNASKFNDVSK